MSIPKEMDDHACDDVVQTTNREGTKLAWRLYRSRGQHLIELNIARERLTSCILLSPTTLEFGQLSSALQFAMQAERSEVYGLVVEAYLEANAAAKRADAAGRDTLVPHAVVEALRQLQVKIEARGVTAWPWAWRTDESALSLAVDDSPAVQGGAGTMPPMPTQPPDVAPPATTARPTARKKR
jgi:hypothetical protein